MSSPQQRCPHPLALGASIDGRQRASRLAPTDTGKALRARGCPDSWYRVQALASVAEHAAPHLALSILEMREKRSRAMTPVEGGP